MIKFSFLLLISIILLGCNKDRLNNKSKIIEGRWEIKQVLFNNKDVTDYFNNDSSYFDYLIFYPKKYDQIVYFHATIERDYIMNWSMRSRESTTGKFYYDLDLLNQPSWTSIYLPIKDSDGWRVEKLTKRKMEWVKDILTDGTYRLVFEKTGKFE